MSCVEIFKFDKNGNSEEYADVKNAWLSAIAVWEILGNKHCGHGVSLFDIEQMRGIWSLVDNKAVPKEERIVLFTTLDKCLVKKEDIPKVIEAFRNFEGNTNLKEQADILKSIFQEDDCIAVGFHQNSCSCEQWYEYNCLKEKEHFWLFDELEESEE